MFEEPTTPSLVDDATFLADLEALDDGLIHTTIRSSSAISRTLERPTLTQTPAAPRFVSNAGDVPIVLQPGSRRPLLDLFPAVPTPARLTPLARGATPAPHVGRPLRVPAPSSDSDAAPPLRRDETFDGFAEPAFRIEPNLRFLYHSVEHDRAAQQLLEAIARRDGVVVITAPSGMGKTLLCQAVADQLDSRTRRSCLPKPPAAFDRLVRTLLVDFGVLSDEEVAARSDAAELRETLRAFLASMDAEQAKAVIILDDAHHISPAVLVAIYALARELPRTLQIVLVGAPALAHLLAQPELQVLQETVARRVELGPLAAEEVPGYVMHHMHVASASPRIDFDDAALERLFALSYGVPRVVNQLCHRALTRAFAVSATTIDARILSDAAVDLGIDTQAGSPRWIRLAAIALLFALLTSVGASGAVWVFHDRVQAIVASWHATSP